MSFLLDWDGGDLAAPVGAERKSDGALAVCVRKGRLLLPLAGGLARSRQAYPMSASARFMFIAIATNWRWQALRASPR